MKQKLTHKEKALFQDIKALIFDMDGVITDTAWMHARAWKCIFDEWLERHAKGSDCPFVPFDIEADYRRYVDGKPRLEGIQSFFASRKLVVDKAEIADLAARKNQVFLALLRDEGVRVFPDAQACLERVTRLGLRIALVTSSRNGEVVVTRAGLRSMFSVLIDGNVAAARGLKGKPAPDTFVEAARGLGVPLAQAAVLEDAVAGVVAGRRGGFGLVIGIARGHSGLELRQNGADLVLSSLHPLYEEEEARRGASRIDPVPNLKNDREVHGRA